MRKLGLAISAAITLVTLPGPSFAQTFEIGPGGVRVQEYREYRGGGRGRGVDCDELRWACRNKDRLGEEGLGNCRRYRDLCERPSRRVCAELRDACENKDLYGEEGRGNCRRYRDTCQR